jgi:hypothetical protein
MMTYFTRNFFTPSQTTAYMTIHNPSIMKHIAPERLIQKKRFSFAPRATLTLIARQRAPSGGERRGGPEKYM